VDGRIEEVCEARRRGTKIGWLLEVVMRSVSAVYDSDRRTVMLWLYALLSILNKACAGVLGLMTVYMTSLMPSFYQLHFNSSRSEPRQAL